MVIIFYSDDIEQRKGFWIFFTPVPVGKYRTFSRDVTAAILVFQNKETVDILM